MEQVINTLRANGLHAEAEAVEKLEKQRSDLVGALKACLEKGKRWHPLERVVVQAKEAIANAEK